MRMMRLTDTKTGLPCLLNPMHLISVATDKDENCYVSVVEIDNPVPVKERLAVIEEAFFECTQSD